LGPVAPTTTASDVEPQCSIRTRRDRDGEGTSHTHAGVPFIEVIVELPLLEDGAGLKTLSLDVAPERVRLRGGVYRLDKALPCAVNVDMVSARFSDSKKRLKLKLPVAEIS
jgi:hypothetical protein